MLEEHPNKYALLDMDYDFGGNQLARVSNAIDTRKRCCLQSYFIETEQLSFTFQRIAKSVYQKDTRKRHELKDFLVQHWPLIKSVALERTYARLFRGKFGIKLKMGKKGDPPVASDLIRHGVTCINDLIEINHRREFQAYKRKNMQHLAEVGINDHAFEEVLIPLVCKHNPELSADYVLSRCKRALKEYIIYHTKNSKSNQIAEELIELISENA